MRKIGKSKISTNLISVIFIMLVGMAMTGCVTFTQLGTAARGGDIREVEALLNKGVDVNEKDSIVSSTALMWAASMGHIEIAKLLIDKGADIDTAITALERLSIESPGARAGHKAGIAMLERFRQKQETARQQAISKEELKRIVQAVVEGAKTQKEEKKPIIKTDIDNPSFSPSQIVMGENDLAVIIGIEGYQSLPKSDYSYDDAKLVKEYVKSLGFKERNIELLTDEKATKSSIEKSIEAWLKNKAKPESRVFVYYSGHGAPEPKTEDAYIVPFDRDPSFIDQTGYSLKRLYDSLGKLPAKEIIVALDSCFSGAGGRSVIAKGARPLVMLMESLQIPQNMAVLSAASGDQISSTYEEKGHGLFTYFMLKGIKGEGDANNDGKLEIDELFEYIKPQVERTARKVYNNEQLPQLIAPDEKQKILLRN